MATNSANILAGPARIYIGTYGTAVAPVSGTPPTLFQHTAGVPSGLQTGYTEVGYTTGPCTFDYKATKTLIDVEQSLAPVDAFIPSEMVQVQFNAYERVFVALKAAYDNVATVSDSTGDLYYGGNAQTEFTPSYFTLFFSHVHRDNAAKFSWACLYKGVSMDGVKLPFEKAKALQYTVTIQAIADTTRSLGDQLFQMKNEK